MRSDRQNGAREQNTAEPVLGVRFRDALAYTADVHRHQVGKGAPIPYIAHLLSVAALVIEDGGDEDQAIAALLHDAVEDQGGRDRLEDIRRRFGDRVAAIVEACTDVDRSPMPPYRERKGDYLAGLPSQPSEVLRVALADKLHNARGLLRVLRQEGPAAWGRYKASPEDKLWFLRGALRVFSTAASGPMVAELERVVGALETRAVVDSGVDGVPVPVGWGGEGGRYRVAACQFRPVLLDTAANLAVMERMAREAATGGARLVVFPECCVTGYGIGSASSLTAERAEVVSGGARGATVRRMESLATELGAGIVFGIVEAAGGSAYSTAVTVLPGVGVAGTYRKTHLRGSEGEVFGAGDRFVAMPAPAGRFGALVGYDLEFPETSRVHALSGCRLVVVPAANALALKEFQRTYARARAIENGLFVVVADCVGRVGPGEFAGESVIVDPLGRVLAEARDKECVLVADVDLGVARDAIREVDHLAERRPGLYGGIAG